MRNMKRVVFILVLLCVCLIGTDTFASGGIDAYTTAILHFNDVDGSSDFVDDSFYTHSVTAYGDAQTDTTYKRFGTSSVFFDGSSDYLSIPDSEDWNFADGDFTLDLWVRFGSIIDTTVFNQNNRTIAKNAATELLYTGNQIYFYYTTDGDWANKKEMTSPWLPSDNTWYHIAVVRNGADGYIFIDGAQLGLTYNFGTDTIFNSTRPFEIGNTSTLDYGLSGWIDEFRVSNGVARWTENFTPPTEEYSVIPEPTTLSFLGLGLLGLVFKRTKK